MGKLGAAVASLRATVLLDISECLSVMVYFIKTISEFFLASIVFL